MENISRFRVQRDEASNDDHLKLGLFLLFALKTTFTWYTNLSANSIYNWDKMENSFMLNFIDRSPR